MVFSKLNYRRFVSVRPRRRSGGYPQIAEIQTVERRLLLTGPYDENGYDENGYDENGYDVNGFDINGYDVNGYDISGYDINGYDLSGYDMNGYNVSGYDINGYDVSGYDNNGYDVAGYDIYGYDVNGYDVGGYDANGYDANGYDANGYDANGLDANGNPDPANTVTTPPWIESIDVTHAPGQTTVSGMLGSDGGDFTGLSISLDGVFSGYSASVDSTGFFTVTISSEVYGNATARLMDSTSTEITFLDFNA